MADVSHQIGNDLTFTNTGDLSVSTGIQESQERVLRRLLTAVNAYIWQASYGGGVPEFVGSVNSADQIYSVVYSQMLLENSVEQSPPPSVTVTPISTGVFVYVSYSVNGIQTALSFSVENPS